METLSPEQWVVQVQQSVRDMLESEGSHDNYRRVPKSLKNENTEIFYVPHVISFGPNHFSTKSPVRDEIEVLKSKVTHKYNKRWPGLLDTVVQNFMVGDPRIRMRTIYGLPRDYIFWEALPWMMVRDGCFLMDILNRFSKEEEAESNEQVTSSTAMDMLSRKPRIQGILDRKRYDPLLNDIVKDMFKKENQLPLWVLEKIVEAIENRGERFERNFVESAVKKLSPIKVNNQVINQELNPINITNQHILSLLHTYMVDNVDNVVNVENRGTAANVENPYTPLVSRAHYTQKSCPSLLSVVKLILKVAAISFILIVLFPVWISVCASACAWEIYKECIKDEAAGTREAHIPTLEELKKLGVKFKKLEGEGIYHIKFDERNSTLHLPKFEVNDKSEIILRNLMALEIYWHNKQKPITRYALLMNDLVNTSADVAILRKHDIIISKLGSDDDVAQLWNSVMVATEMPACKPIDTAASGINSYRKRWVKILWAQFKMLHCSKPWLMLSLLGGISLLMLTVIQVACLFRHCQS